MFKYECTRHSEMPQYVVLMVTFDDGTRRMTCSRFMRESWLVAMSLFDFWATIDAECNAGLAVIFRSLTRAKRAKANPKEHVIGRL